jgi:phage terminase large subunit-like protein
MEILMPPARSSPSSSSSASPSEADVTVSPPKKSRRSPASKQQLVGSSVPRLETPTSTLTSRGQQLIDLGDVLGIPLLPWQQHVALNAHRVQDDGTWESRVCGLTVARQNGKTHLLRLRILAGLLLWGERLVVATAQSREVALETFRGVLEIAENSPDISRQIRRVARTNGKEELELKNGARYRIVAPTPGGARGLTADLAIIDELREHHDWTVWAALTYTLQTTGGQLWVASNAGAADSVVLNSIRDQAIATMAGGEDRSLYYAEWSADPKRDLDDRDGWVEANPSLGHLITADTIAGRMKTDPVNVFRTEALCQWVDVLDSPWPADAWQNCGDPALAIHPTAPSFLGIDVTPDRRSAALTLVQQLDDGQLGVHLLQTWEADGAVDDLAIAQAVAPIARKLQARSVAFDRYTAISIAQRLAAVGIPIGDCSGSAFYQACDETLSSMVAKRIIHGNQETLTEHVLGCAKKTTSDGGWRIVRKGSSGTIAAAVAMVMALHYAAKPLPKAEVYFA